jgi:vancomycin permeability regulator SanA
MSYQDPSEMRYSSDMSSFLKTVGYLSFLAVVLGIIFLVLGCFKISSYAFKTYESIDKIPHHKVGLLLGTSSLDSTGHPNDFFTYRIMAASQLFKAGKIEYILVSGDNRHKSYNEPRQMTRALVKAGVPANRIVPDYAGNSTLDSVIRAKKVFLLKSVTVISQDFQNERALFIADKYDLKAVGFNALSPEFGIFSKLGIREILARFKCVLDIYILNTQPMYLGDPEVIGKSPLPKEMTNKPKHMTSPLKQLTDSAYQLNQEKKMALYEPLAKKLTDSASILKAKEERAIAINNELKDEGYNQLEEDPVLSSQQSELLSDERKEALEQASEIASDSLNAAKGSTYIDPNTVVTDEAQGKNLEQKQKVRRKKIVRKDIKSFNGDPWDYY